MRPAPRHCRARRPAPRHAAGAAPRRTSRPLTAVLLVGGLVASLMLSAKANAPAPQPAASAGAMLGAYVSTGGSWSRERQQRAVTDLEFRLGRPLALDQIFVPWGSPLSRWLWRADWDLANGRTPIIAIGRGVDTREVAAGRHDAELRSVAAAIRSLRGPVFLRWASDPDLESAQAWVHSGRDYVAAWRHVHALFQDVDVAFVWSAMASTYAGARGGVDQYWPGGRYVDWVAADGFNRYRCPWTRWRSLEDLFQPFHAWGMAKAKPLMITEVGSTEDPADPLRKARWFDQATRSLSTRLPGIKAVVYFNSKSGCGWNVDSSPASLAGFTRLAQHPWFQLEPTTLIEPQPPASTTTTRAPATTTTTRAPTTTVPSTTSTTAPPAGGGLSGKLVPADGALWGSSRVTDELQTKLGRRFDIAHTYNDWRSDFPTASQRAMADAGIIPLLGWESRIFSTGEIIRWASIANGNQDAVIDAAASRVKQFGRKLFLAFHHEPEDNVGEYGTVADYAAAYRHIHRRFAAAGVTNVVWVWNVMGYSGYYDQYTGGLYPGDAYVDWVAWDPYNWHTCHDSPWIGFGDKVGQFYTWLGQHGFADKPYMLGEYGTPEHPDDPNAKADWFAGIVPALQRLPNLKAVVYFNSTDGPTGCDWRIETSTAALRAFAASGDDPYLNQR